VTSEEPHNQEKTSDKVINSLIEDEMKSAYLDYAMSVIVGRALPDIRDGLKPVHRRILFAMNEMGMFHNKPYKKCARIVGEVLGKYHPHGDNAVYDSLVRMAQDFSLRYPLIKGQGNFGSVDGDSAAAMRYTEAKLEKLSGELLTDIDKNTVDFIENFDGSLKEPTVLPTKIPQLLLNGTNGIAVGMATNIPPHNINEVIEGTITLLENEETSIAELSSIIKGPDFPTGGIITGKNGIMQAYATGRGKFKTKSVMHEEEVRGTQAIIITQIPYQVNKANLIEQIADCVRDKKIEGIKDIRDESNREGTRVVIELKKDNNIEVVKNQLLKHTRLQISTGIILLAIKNKQPKIFNIKEMLEEFIAHRKEIIKRRTAYDLDKAEKKAHLLEGLTKALNYIDQIIALIKQAETGPKAKEGLCEKYSFSELQAQAILDMKLQKLTGLEQEQIKKDYDETLKLITELKNILEDINKIKQIIKEELTQIRETYGSERKTQILDCDDEDIEDEDLIPKENQVITITKTGYAKRLPLDTYKLQRRGGKGVIGAQMNEEDLIEHLFVANTHSYLLIFTNKGKAYWLKVYKLPESSRTAKGKALVNLVQLEKEEKIAAIIPIEEFSEEEYLFMATKKGVVKKTNMMAYSRPRQTGIIGITLDEGDRVVSVKKTTGDNEILLATKQGQAIKFDESDARPIGRTSRGVRGISLNKEDEVIGMIIASPEETVLTVTENGYGKRTKLEEYRKINRGGKGVRNIICSERNGKVCTIRAISGSENIILISKKGIVIRTQAEQINIIGRNTQGVRLMNLSNGDYVQDIALIKEEKDECEEGIRE
jgi:DNA gyrase subunit A